MKQHIVITDPTGRVWPGSLISEDSSHALAARGVQMLPCDPELFLNNGIGGFIKREWGSGWPLDGTIPSMKAPMLIGLTPYCKHLHWLARIMPPPAGLHDGWKERIGGSLSVATDLSQHNSRIVPGWNPDSNSRQIMPRDLGELDSAGGWTWRGSGEVLVHDEAIYGFSFYGFAPGLRLVWAAMSATLS